MSVEVNINDLATVAWAARQHLEWREEWASQEAEHYPPGEYERDTADLLDAIEHVDDILARESRERCGEVAP